MRTDPLLLHYPVRIREVTLGVILFISLLFYIFPRFLGEAQKFTKTGSSSSVYSTCPRLNRHFKTGGRPQ